MPAVHLPRDDDPATAIPQLDAFPETGTPLQQKLGSWDFYRSIGSPKNVVAPMVDQSELAWRILSRRYASDLVYTPMINSRRFVQSTSSRGHEHDVDFWIAKDKSLQEEGRSRIASTRDTDTDDPIIVQFCANDPDLLLQAARVVEPYCNAVDLNLGCPQQIARRGHYGSFLQSDWHLIFRLINTLHVNLSVPVTAKMRVFDSVERTVAYARMLERAGAQIIAVHGRTREMKGHKTGLADWTKIKAVKEAVNVPVFANGNILFHHDVQRALQLTGADGVMSAEGNLHNPTIFATPADSATELYPLAPAFPFPRIAQLASEYLDICQSLHTPTAASAIKAHLFRLARPALEVHRDLRPLLGKATLDLKAASVKDKFAALRAFVERLADLLEADEKDARYTALIDAAMAKGEASWKVLPDVEPDYIPHWLAQPYYRKTMPPKDEDEQTAEQRKEKRKLRLQETAAGLTSIQDVQTDGEVLAAQASTSNALAPAASAKRLKHSIEEAQSYKARANGLFAQQDYEQAILTYTEALNCLPPRAMPSSDDGEGEEEEESIAKGKGREVDEGEEERGTRLLRAVVYANLAACHAKLEQHREAVVACNEALQDDPVYIKALHRRAQANEKLGSWSGLTSAMEDYKAIERLPDCPASLRPSLRASMARLGPEIEQAGAREKDEMLGKLKGIGDSMLGWFGLSTDNFQMQKGEGGGYSLNFVR